MHTKEKWGIGFLISLNAMATGYTLQNPTIEEKLFTLYTAEVAGLYGYIQNRDKIMQGQTSDDDGENDDTAGSESVEKKK